MKTKIELQNGQIEKLRIQQLIELGFKYNMHQEAYILSVFGGDNCDLNGNWYVDDWRIMDRTDGEWADYLITIKNDKKKALKWKNDNESNFPRKVIIDRLNELKSKISVERQPKLNKSFNELKIANLEIRIDELQQILTKYAR